MTSQELLVQRRGDADWLILNRPHRLNAFTWRLRDELLEAVEASRTNDSAAVVLSGVGRGFCSGIDVKDVLLATPPPEDHHRSELLRTHELVRALSAFPKPTFAAVNGVAAGAGWSLALATDAVVACASARFVSAFIRIGLVPDLGAMWFLPRRVGQLQALNVMLRGRALDSSEALRIGAVQHLVPDRLLVDSVDRLVRGEHIDTELSEQIDTELSEQIDTELSEQIDTELSVTARDRELDRTPEMAPGAHRQALHLLAATLPAPRELARMLREPRARAAGLVVIDGSNPAGRPADPPAVPRIGEEIAANGLLSVGVLAEARTPSWVGAALYGCDLVVASPESSIELGTDREHDRHLNGLWQRVGPPGMRGERWAGRATVSGSELAAAGLVSELDARPQEAARALADDLGALSLPAMRSIATITRTGRRSSLGDLLAREADAQVSCMSGAVYATAVGGLLTGDRVT